jgi:hypothetical protein
MYWLLGRKSKLSLPNKILLYKTMLKPIWSYGLQLWGCAKPTSLNIIERFQSKVLRSIVNASWYVSNQSLHNDLKIPFIRDEIHQMSARYNEQITNHENELVEELSNKSPGTRRLNRKWPQDLLE